MTPGPWFRSVVATDRVDEPGQGAVIYLAGEPRGRVVRVSELAAVALELLEENRTTDELATELVKRFGSPPGEHGPGRSAGARGRVGR